MSANNLIPRRYPMNLSRYSKWGLCKGILSIPIPEQHSQAVYLRSRYMKNFGGYSAFMAQILQQLRCYGKHSIDYTIFINLPQPGWLEIAHQCANIGPSISTKITHRPQGPWPAPPRCCPSGPFRWLPGPRAWATVKTWHPFTGEAGKWIQYRERGELVGITMLKAVYTIKYYMSLKIVKWKVDGHGTNGSFRGEILAAGRERIHTSAAERAWNSSTSKKLITAKVHGTIQSQFLEACVWVQANARIHHDWHIYNEGPQPRSQKCLFLRPQKQAPCRARLPELGLCSQDSMRWAETSAAWDWRPRV